MENFDVSKLDGHTLRIFLSVCETSSVTQTAQHFDLNQSTVSHSIEKMRSALNDPLFVKSGRGIVPTELALRIVPRVQKILAEIEGLVVPANYDPQQDQKPISIAISTPALVQDMRWLYCRLRELHPKTEFILRRLAPREKIEEILSQDLADLAISIAGIPYPATLESAVYGYEKLTIYYDAYCRAPIRSLGDYESANHGVVNFGGAKQSEISKAMSRLGIQRRVTLVAPALDTLGQMMRGTDVIATMPARLDGVIYIGLETCELPFDFEALQYDLVWHRRYGNSGRNIWLRNLMMEASRLFYDETAKPSPT